MSWISRSSEQLSELQRQIKQLTRDNEAASVELDRLRTAFNALPIGVILASESGAVLLSNQAAESFTGHAQLLVSESADRHLKRAIQGRDSGQRVEFYGPPRQVVNVHALPLPGGGALATVEDISERARLDAVRTDFVANISHELKTPVGALAVLAEALVDNDDEATNRRLAEKMLDEAHRASRTIDDLLELSRIELGGAAVREAVDVDILLEDAASRNLVSAEHRHVAIEVRRNTGLKILGDSRQLASALNNLIDNAVKYSEAGQAVNLDATPADEYVAITVADRGAGIPAKDVDRVFERFYRVDRARSRGTGGTGLGLSIVRHVATNHAGAVTVESREGEGSTFTLRIPRYTPLEVNPPTENGHAAEQRG